MTKNNKTILSELNANWPSCVLTLGGSAIQFSQENKTLDMTFDASEQFCHSGNIVQGGFISGMLDAVMAYSLIGLPGVCQGVATLEIKVSFISPGHPGVMYAKGWVVHHGRSIGYLAGDLTQNEQLVATATSTVKLIPFKS